MRLPVLALAIFAPALFAQPSTTQILDTVYGTFGSPPPLYNGSVKITLSVPGGTSGGHPIINLAAQVKIVGGVLKVNLIPNDTITPANSSYLFVFDNGNRFSCIVPTSMTPITLAGCVPPTLSLRTITNSQLATLTNSQLATLTN